MGRDGGRAFDRGRALEADGEHQAARRCYREAAESGHRAAAVLLGGLLASGSVSTVDELAAEWPVESAEKWWQRGIEGLDAGSARELGRLLDWDPELVETEHGLRVAYEAGDVEAGYWLAALLEERGSRDDRGYLHGDGWLREAGELLEDVWSRTSRTARSIRRRFARWWYPSRRLHAYALVRGRHRGSPAGEYPRRLLEREHGRGKLEATFLLGLLGGPHEAEEWLRTAAEAGHRQAAFELGARRADARDGEGAVTWFRRAAGAGHPGAAFDLAFELCTTDRAAAEAECRKAARSGNLRAAALLRVLERGGPPEQRDARATELLAAWAEVSGLAPNPDRCVDYLTERSGLPRADIARTRKVRDQCAHPAEQGRPTSYELDIALTTARALREQIAG